MKTIEEKAKAYDDAFERAKQIRNGNPSSGTAIVVCEQIFPELRESEDERMMREFNDWLCEEIECRTNDLRDEKDRRTLNMLCYVLTKVKEWLKKQKEQKPLSPEDKVKHPLYVEGFEAGKEVGRQYEKVFGEQKPADKDFPPLEGVDAIKAKYYDKGFKNGFDEGVDSVKTAEWSEEDEDAVRHICRYLGYHCNEATARGCTKWLNVRLKSLRPQPKQECSEENELNTCPHYSDGYGCDISPMKKCESCEHRPSWKPSEEQIAILWDAISNLKHDGYKHTEELISLYEELKKL